MLTGTSRRSTWREGVAGHRVLLLEGHFNLLSIFFLAFLFLGELLISFSFLVVRFIGSTLYMVIRLFAGE